MRTALRHDLATILVHGRMGRILSFSTTGAAVAFLARVAHPAPVALGLAIALLAIGGTGLAYELVGVWRRRQALVTIPLRVDGAHRATPTQAMTPTRTGLSR